MTRRKRRNRDSSIADSSADRRNPQSAIRNPQSAGFTLAELLVVVVIIGLTAGMVIPYVSSASESAAIAGARMLVCDLQYAQNTAITTQSPVTVQFVAGMDYYVLSNASGTLIHPMKKTAYVVNFSAERGFEGLDIVSADFGGATAVVFDELGSPDNAGSIVLQGGSQEYVINVAAATGKVTVSAGGS